MILSIVGIFVIILAIDYAKHTAQGQQQQQQCASSTGIL